MMVEGLCHCYIYEDSVQELGTVIEPNKRCFSHCLCHLEIGVLQQLKLFNIKHCVHLHKCSCSIFMYVLCLCIAGCHANYTLYSQTKDALTTALTTVFAIWSLEYSNN